MAFSGGAGADLGSARGTIEISTEGAERALKQLQGSVGTFASSTDNAFNRIATGLGLLAGSRAIAGIFTGGVTAAADFESQVSAIAAVAGATGNQLDELRQKALQLGKDTSFSASEAASAIEELAKAGVPIEDILNGAADGATALAAAAGISLPNAAITMANAMNIFGLSASQATHVADVFAAASNKSAADADGLAQALAQVGTVADQFNVSFEDTVGALALFADQGLKGSDAGTSLKTALTAMLAPVGEGADAIQTLGLNFRDAQGNFIGLAGAADELRRVLGPLGVAERDAALRAIFGSDAIRVGAILYGEGGDAVRDYTAAVNDSGAAQENARKRLDNFNGALEQLRGSIETASIIIGAALLPALKEIVQAVTAVVNAFVDLPGPVQAVLAGLVGASGVIAGIAGVIVLAGPKMAAFGEALTTIRTALLGFAAANPIILAVVAALALFGLAYRKNFGGFADTVNAALDRIKAFAAAFARSFNFSRSLPDIGNVGAAFAALGQAMTEVLGINVYKQFRAIGNVADRIGKSLNRMKRQIDILGRAFKRGGLQEGFDQLFGKVGLNLLAEFGDVIGALPRTVGTALRQIRTGIDPLDRLFLNLGSALQQFGRFVENVFAGNFDKALANLQNIGKRLKAGAIDISGIVVRVVSWAVQEGVSLATAVYDFVTTDLWPRIKTTATDLFDAAVNIASFAIDATGNLIGDVAAYITDTAWPAVKDTATDIADAAVSIASWSVRAAAGIWDAVSAVAVSAWNLVKHVAIGIPDALIAVKNFVVSLGDSVWGAVGGAILTAWDAVKDTAIDIKDVALNVTSWLTDQIEAGTLIDSVKAFVEEQLSTLDVTISDWKLTVSAPDGDGITVDVGTIWDKIWNDIINPTFTPEQIEGAERAGATIGQKAVDLIVGGIRAVFTGFGTGGVGGGEEKLTGKDLIGGFIRGLFAGAFAEGLGEGVDLYADASAWAGRQRDRIITAIREAFTGGSRTEFRRGLGGGGFTTTEFDGIFDAIREFFTTNPLEGVDFPDLAKTVTDWFDQQVENIKTAITEAIPEWLGMLARGDILGAVKALGGGGGGGLTASQAGLLFDFGRGNIGKKSGKVGFFGPEIFDTIEADGQQLGTSLGDGIVTGITNKKPDIAAALRQATQTGTGENAKSADFRQPDAPKPIVMPAPDLSALIKGFATAVKVTTGTMAAIVDAAARIVDPIADAGRSASQSFAAGIGLGMRIAIQAAAAGAVSVVNAARANLSSLGPSGFGVGQSLGFGIAAGIASTISVVASSAVALVNAAVNAARSAAQIASPSRLFAEKVGLPIAQGMAVGISDGSRTVQRSIASLIGASLPTTSTARMVGSQPVGAVAGGGPTVIYQTFALKSDEYLDLIQKAERGHNAETTWENIPRSHGLVYGR